VDDWISSTGVFFSTTHKNLIFWNSVYNDVDISIIVLETGDKHRHWYSNLHGVYIIFLHMEF